MAESSDVWVLIEHRGGDSEESSLEAVAAGRELAERLERRCVAVVVESEAPTLAAKSLGAAGADVVFAVSPEPTVARSPEGLGAVLEAVVAEGDPRLLQRPAPR